MPQFAANLSWMYQEHAFLDRFAAASADGFKAVECLFPYAEDRHAMAQRLCDAGLDQVLLNAPPGQAGERGMAIFGARQDEFRRGFAEQALPCALALGCPRIHVMAGTVPDGADLEALRETYLANLAWAAQQATAHGISVLIEPLNARDAPGYFLSTQAQAHAVVAEVGAPNLAVQMDLYHVQISEGDVSTRLAFYLADPATSRVGHIQIAGVPERREPDTGELNYPHLFALIDRLGYRGHIGCEYKPRGATSAGLGWVRPWL